MTAPISLSGIRDAAQAGKVLVPSEVLLALVEAVEAAEWEHGHNPSSWCRLCIALARFDFTTPPGTRP